MKKTLEERFYSKINKIDSCWIWTASKNDQNYGLIWVNGKHVRAHRISYMLAYGELSDKLVIDHLCRNTLCVNPEHLEQVPQSENVKRGMAGKINNAQRKKTHCPKGHEYSRVTKQGYRQCGTCRSRQEMESRKRRIDRSKKML
jgi:hypothetical protein